MNAVCRLPRQSARTGYPDALVITKGSQEEVSAFSSDPHPRSPFCVSSSSYLASNHEQSVRIPTYYCVSSPRSNSLLDNPVSNSLLLISVYWLCDIERQCVGAFVQGYIDND